MNIPDNLLYTKEHEWILIEGNRGKVGITDYAQSRLGDITYVEFPSMDKEIKQFVILTSIESVKAASDIYAPMSGKIIQVNAELEKSPEIVNKAPYGDGWIAIIEIKNASEKNNLMDSKIYKKYLEGIKK